MMLSCRKATQLMSEEHERALTARERLELQVHNALCKGCTQYRKQIRFLRRATRALRDGEAE